MAPSLHRLPTPCTSKNKKQAPAAAAAALVHSLLDRSPAPSSFPPSPLRSLLLFSFPTIFIGKLRRERVTSKEPSPSLPPPPTPFLQYRQLPPSVHADRPDAKIHIEPLSPLLSLGRECAEPSRGRTSIAEHIYWRGRVLNDLL